VPIVPPKQPDCNPQEVFTHSCGVLPSKAQRLLHALWQHSQALAADAVARVERDALAWRVREEEVLECPS